MELRHLRYFVAVARELSFTKASRQLRVAQPALSRQIQQLEEELGVRLLDRDRHGTKLTESGRAFLAEASALLEQSERAIQVVQKTGQGITGQLNVGYIWTLFHSSIPDVLNRFREVRPEVAVHLFDLTAAEQAAALTEGKLDAGFIGFAHEAEAAGLARRKVGRCSFVVALPKTHRAARQRGLSLKSLADEVFLMISDQSYPGASKIALDACLQAGFRPKTVQSVARGYAILSLVAARCGIALLPEPLRKLPHADVVFRPLQEELCADLFMAWCAGRSLPILDAFLSLFPEPLP
jgi:DNA-binding transcriptional LysR family regulator